MARWRRQTGSIASLEIEDSTGIPTLDVSARRFHTDPERADRGLAERPRRLAYSWNASGDKAANGLKSVVTWTLTPTDAGAFVRMEHSGFRRKDSQRYEAMGGGWRRIVAGLERVTAGWTKARRYFAAAIQAWAGSLWKIHARFGPAMTFR